MAGAPLLDVLLNHRFTMNIEEYKILFDDLIISKLYKLSSDTKPIWYAIEPELAGSKNKAISKKYSKVRSKSFKTFFHWMNLHPDNVEFNPILLYYQLGANKLEEAPDAEYRKLT